MSILNLFKRKDVKEQIGEESIRQRSADYYTIIGPSEISIPVDEILFSKGTWSSEDEYREYLTKVQPLIDEYETSGEIHTINYDSMEDIELHREEQRMLDSFNDTFLSYRSHINVTKQLDGTYKVASDGRHRMVIAKKYNLRLIVHVCAEEYVD